MGRRGLAGRAARGAAGPTCRADARCKHAGAHAYLGRAPIGDEEVLVLLAEEARPVGRSARMEGEVQPGQLDQVDVARGVGVVRGRR